MSTVSATAWGLLARVPPGPPGPERGEEFGKTSPIALVVILLLGLATVLLIRSMSKRLRNVPESFDHVPDPRRARARPDPATPPDDVPDDARGADPTGSP